jgi:hypothetical protein
MKPGVGWNEKKGVTPNPQVKDPLQMKDDGIEFIFHISNSSSAYGVVMEEQTGKTR